MPSENSSTLKINYIIILFMVVWVPTVCAVVPTMYARLGLSVGSPIPVGDVPAGAHGSAIPGVVVGAGADWQLSDLWTIASEVQYVHYSASFRTPMENQPYIDRVNVKAPDGSTAVFEVNTTFSGMASGKFSNDYVQIPVLAKYRASESVAPYVGGYLGWLLGTGSVATGVGTVGIRTEIVEKSLYFDEKINGLDYGVQCGAWYQVSRSLGLDLRAVVGLTSIFAPGFVTIDRTVSNIFLHGTVQYFL